MSNLFQRTATAITLIAVILGSLFILNKQAATFVFLLFLSFGSWEWGGFLFPRNVFFKLLYSFFFLVISICFYIVLTLIDSLSSFYWLALVWWLIIILLLLKSYKEVTSFWVALSGYLIMIPAAVALLGLIRIDHGEFLIISAISIVSAADIGAYFFGKKFGKSKLAPSISPGKTWEGFFGGLIFSLFIGCILAASLGYHVFLFTLTAGLLAILSLIGDLTVSAFKRQAGLKDSGFFLPGHGGVLDRIDGLVAALPLFMIMLEWMKT
ncbi:MAG: phosphatidate cytidylyltransferase [Pseudomonadota bacterium]|nr:phosphatidate cytidylyltransferase [Pseudomonadota bacterium]